MTLNRIDVFSSKRRWIIDALIDARLQNGSGSEIGRYSSDTSRLCPESKLLFLAELRRPKFSDKIRFKVIKHSYSWALKGYQDAVGGMKSQDRDEAKRLGF